MPIMWWIADRIIVGSFDNNKTTKRKKRRKPLFRTKEKVPGIFRDFFCTIRCAQKYDLLNIQQTYARFKNNRLNFQDTNRDDKL